MKWLIDLCLKETSHIRNRRMGSVEFLSQPLFPVSSGTYGAIFDII